MKPTLIFILFITFVNVSIWGQYSNTNWIFGNHVGLNFNQTAAGYPTPFYNSTMATDEGVACISDESGNLLFYTDGRYLWDNNNNVLSSTLKGDISSTQSAIIVPNPSVFNNSRNYYIFTVDAWGGCSWTNPIGYGIHYSIVNVNFNNPITVTLTQENISLSSNISFRENLMGVSKSNNAGFWVISRQYAVNNTTGSNSFYVWEVTSAGVNSTPQIFNIGSIQNVSGSAPGNLSYNGSIGYLKISPNGTILAKADNYANTVELFRFDPVIGQVLPFNNSGNTILTNLTRAYGVEFSPNNQYLYVSQTYNNAIHQYDLSDTLNVNNSKITLSTTISGTQYIKGGMQLGPDNKIYIVKYNSNKMAVIANPDNLGNACNLTDDAFTLASGTTGRLGLPTFLPTRAQSIAINEFNYDNSISIYPNPSSDFINVNYPGGSELLINLMTIDNKILISKYQSQGQSVINISNLSNGIYIMSIDVLDNNKNTVKMLYRKVIKN